LTVTSVKSSKRAAVALFQKGEGAAMPVRTPPLRVGADWATWVTLAAVLLLLGALAIYLRVG
jgi:hypothetical protein